MTGSCVYQNKPYQRQLFRMAEIKPPKPFTLSERSELALLDGRIWRLQIRAWATRQNRRSTKMKQGDLDELTRNDEKVAIVKWKDSRMVLLASTCARATNAEPVKRWSKKEKCIDVPPPEVVRRYNASMGEIFLELKRCRKEVGELEAMLIYLGKLRAAVLLPRDDPTSFL
ncbi:hypothetical protein HPB51_000382 [Rhipicephalus microplus]|uniref:Uncharacterized protein n=1 Tax=Rhipicephalus microplus TaxID=6941 RepID=A0A9J6DDU4_RHIMP|nr:hypothetical protein HPB51_000382 [Rhipicephalus microplus]